jgi:MinD-like ATPase involved in chromosome partitioning or flagellar assembly
MKPFWITFYSYKGGVGRSLAVANIAALLVKNGRRVVIIDFDLEAPGLDSFPEFSDVAGKPGVLEYVSKFVQDRCAPNIEDFVYTCTLPGHVRGKLWIMPAGRRDAAYDHQLNRISWAKLYDEGIGRPFFENWKAAINKRFVPDFVFIDSRTGLTEIGGVSTTQFPDLVVMLFGLNDQNVRGVAKVAESIQQADPSRVPQIHYVATPVPNLTPDKRSELTLRLHGASKHLGVEIKSMLRYYPPAALSEKLFVLLDIAPIPQIALDYDRLLKEIIDFNRRGLDFLLTQFPIALENGDTDRILRFRGVIERDYADRTEGRYLLSQIAGYEGKIKNAVRFAEEACALDPAYEAPFNFLKAHYTRARKHIGLVELCERILEHEDKLPPKFLFVVHSTRGENALALGEPKIGEMSYRWCKERAVKDNAPAEHLMIYTFNAAEAHRRASGKIDVEEWDKVVARYNKAAVGVAPLPNEANRFQAMHIAFACVGDRQAALDILKKARRASDAVSEVEDIFSVKVYRNVSASEFRTINDEMTASVERGELWDGMRLPQAEK